VCVCVCVYLCREDACSDTAPCDQSLCVPEFTALDRTDHVTVRGSTDYYTCYGCLLNYTDFSICRGRTVQRILN